MSGKGPFFELVVKICYKNQACVHFEFFFSVWLFSPFDVSSVLPLRSTIFLLKFQN